MNREAGWLYIPTRMSRSLGPEHHQMYLAGRDGLTTVPNGV
jgi:hypothetical protein